MNKNILGFAEPIYDYDALHYLHYGNLNHYLSTISKILQNKKNNNCTHNSKYLLFLRCGFKPNIILKKWQRNF